MILWLIISIVALLVFLAGVTLKDWPLFITKISRYRAGFVRHSIPIDDFDLVYFETGKRHAPTLLLIHGFGGDSNSWIFFVPFLRANFHIIVIDMPGFGETGYVDDKSYSLDRQVARLEQFVAALQLENFHLVGHSLGGYLAAAYAAAHPKGVQTLGLFSAAGVDVPKITPFHQALLDGENWLIVRNYAEFRRFMDLVYYKHPWLPSFMCDYFVQRKKAGANEQERVFDEMFTDHILLGDRLSALKMPTLILWGDNDQVLDVSSVNAFKLKIPHAQIAVMPNCGHVPIIEKARITATVYKEFLVNVNAMPSTSH